MKNCVHFLIVCTFVVFQSINTHAQAFTTPHDTVASAAIGLAVLHNDITNRKASNLIVNWRVAGSDFPSDWRQRLGICDNVTCYSNTASDSSLWNGTFGALRVSGPYFPDTAGLFDMQINLTGKSAGTHHLTVSITDTATPYFSKSVTFVVTNWPTGVTTVRTSTDDIVTYPNPATNELNVLFDQGENVKTISVCNIIGRAINVYKVSGNSARLDIGNLPSGIYFIRLANAQGDIVATRKFNKQ